MGKDLGKRVYDIVAAGDTEGFESLLKEYRLSLGKSGRRQAYFNLQLCFVREAVSRHNANILKCLPLKFENFTVGQLEEYWRQSGQFCANAYDNSDESKDVIKVLLCFAAEKGSQSAFLEPLLQRAILKRNVNAVRYFLELVAERNCTGENWVYRATLYMELSDNLDSDKEIVAALLTASSDADSRQKLLSRLLQEAVLKHRVSAVKCFLELGSEHGCTGKDWVNLSRLRIELSSDTLDSDKEIVAALLSASSDADRQHAFLLALLQQTILKHNINAVKCFLELGSEHSCTGKNWVDLSRLRMELSGNLDNDKEIVDALLAASSDTDSQHIFLSQLLQQAVLEHSLDVVKYFLELGSEHSCTGKDWVDLSRLRMELSDNLDNDKEIVDALLATSTDTNSQHVFLSQLLQQAVLEHSMDVVKYFLELGSEHSCTSKGWVDLSTVNMRLSKNLMNDKEMVQALLAASSDISKQDAFLLRLLQQAVEMHKARAVEYFLELGSERSCTGKDWVDLSTINMTLFNNPSIDCKIALTLLGAVTDAGKKNAFLLRLLQQAICKHYSEIVKSLLDCGANPGRSDNDWAEVSSVCIDNYYNASRDKKILKALLNAVTDADKKNLLLSGLLQKEICRHDTEAATYLLNLGVDLSETDLLYDWIKRYDCSNQKGKELLEALLKASADPNRQNILHNNTTALHAAAEKGAIDLMKLLIQHGADINKEDSGGLNPIVYGFSNGIDFTKEMRQEELIDFSYRNSRGENYLMLFLKQAPSINEARSFVKLAIDEHLDFNETTEDGKNVLDYLPCDDNGRLKWGYGKLKKGLQGAIDGSKEENDDTDFSDIGF